ncbi:MAG TPA: ABC transporter permease, partial [Symbiobacteriaceae bacterium]|nr:ABC transporter permease [Symbiobacteriaceae bacterium]
MTLRQLAWKNIRFRLRSLLGFALAATFGAWLFFLFASMRYNPVLGPMVAHWMPSMELLQLIVVAVAIVTALNALGASIRERGRELGLLQLQGMSWRHLGALLAWETFLIGYGSSGVGIGVGVLTGKLLFLVFSKAIRSSQPVAFTFESGAVLETLLFFGIVFAAAGLISARYLGRRSLADLLRAASRRDGALTVSRWQVVLCLISYLGAGWLCFSVNLNRGPISAWFG